MGTAESFDFAAVDLGASGTRVTNKKGKIYEIPNNMVFVDAGEKIDMAPHVNGVDEHADFCNSMDITIIKKEGGKCSHFPCRVLVGDLVDRYSATCIRPSVMMNKAAQRVNFVSAIIAAAHQQLIAGNSEAIDLYLALPPMEVSVNKEFMAQQLSGKYSVTFNKMGGKEVEVYVKSVTCVEESFMALVSFFFDMSGKKTANADTYGEGNVLSLDIGASTTDACIAKNMRLQEKSGQTFKTGGNVIQLSIANAIRGKYGYDPVAEELNEVVATGRLRRGNTYVEMGDALQKAKQDFARSIVSQLQDYFRLINIPLQTVRAIIVSGGGSLESGYDTDGKHIVTCAPVSEFITRELSNIVDGIEVIGIDENPRWANIKGMFIRAMMIAAKKQKEAAAAESAAGITA